MEHTEFTPDWENAISIMNYMAIDADGEIWHFENLPILKDGFWLPFDGAGACVGTTTPPTDFTKCLYERPQTQTENEQ